MATMFAETGSLSVVYTAVIALIESSNKFLTTY